MIIDLLVLVLVIIVLVQIRRFFQHARIIQNYRTIGMIMLWPLLLFLGLSQAATYLLMALLAIPKVIWLCIAIVGYIRIKTWPGSGYELFLNTCAMLFWLLLPIVVLSVIKI